MQGQLGKVFIGKDINRTGSLVIGGASDNIANGEVVVLDENKNIMAAGTTYADSKVIYLVEGLSGTYDYTNEAGTQISDVRKLLYSDAIDGAGVSVYSGTAYTAPVEEVWSIDLTGWTPVVGTEYRIRFVYTDLTNDECPTQYTKTYQYIAETATLDTEGAAIAALINADKNRRVNATYTTGTDVLAFTAIAYDDNDEVSAINDYKQVVFSVYLVSDNFDTYTSSAQTTAPEKGAGHYKLVRDEERWAEGNEGVLNKTAFPVLRPDYRTVKDETYDTVVITHKNWFTAADRREKQVDITSKIFIPNTATSNQMGDVLAVLNPWMASLPKAFANVSF
jgi:hypothetical protein